MAGAELFGVVSGDCDGGNCGGCPFDGGPNGSPPRTPGAVGYIPVMGVAEKSEFCDCADAGSEPATAAPNMTAMSASAGHSRPRTQIANALLMTRSFSAKIEAISSRRCVFVTLGTLC